MRQVIAFGHRRRVGKDTAATYLSSQLRRTTQKHVVLRSFARKLKEVCHDLYGWAGLENAEFYERPENDGKREEILPAIGKSPREIWINFGTLVARNVHGGTWCDWMLKSKGGTLDCDVLIITDLRFPNEVEAVRQVGGVLVKVTRDSVEQTDDVADGALKDFDDWDYVIHNNDSINDLFAKVDGLRETLFNEDANT